MPLLETKGAGSAQGFGLSLGGEEAVYIEDVFNTWLIKPTTVNTTYSVTNGIDVSGEGGMVWMKARDAAQNNLVYDTARGASAGANNALITNSSAAQQTANFDYITGLSNGFTVNFASGGGQLTNDGINYASWTFRKAPKFFDVVTYTGDGVAGRTVAHNLGSVPGCIIVKRTDAVGAWHVFHTSLGATKTLFLNVTNAASTDIRYWDNTAPTAAVFTLGFDTDVNASGGTYVAYLFAHNAGGFGLTGTDNVISCGSYTGNGSATGPVITLGYEPQWVMVKRSNNTNSWYMVDTMRGFTVPQTSRELAANSSAAEAADYAGAFPIRPLATGFQPYTADNGVNGSGDTYIYIAIRRGPMKVPTSGTQVFATNTETEVRSNSSNWTSLSGFPVDLFVTKKVLLTDGTRFIDRLRTYSLTSSNADAEVTAVFATFDTNNGVKMGPVGLSGSSTTYSDYLFQRAPGFFDVVCYTGTGSNTNFSHNLNVAPQLIILKNRGNSTSWFVPYSGTSYLILNNPNSGANGSGAFDLSLATASTFWLGADGGQSYNGSGQTYVAYLFATLAGVSKVGSYTGTGTTQVINCGFTAGSRFVMIKRTDSTGDWYVWDSARGIIAGNDPYLLLNSTAAEVTSTDYVDTASTGFEISSTAPAAINANGGTFIFLAIA